MKNQNTRKSNARSQHAQVRRQVQQQARNRNTSHFMQPQICVLYLASSRQYIVEFAPDKIVTTDAPELAKLYEDDEASSAALAFLEVTGKFIKVRPYMPCHGGLVAAITSAAAA